MWKIEQNLENIEYVVYCRKSTDESSGNQKQSIPDQIEACLKYAERENLKIMWKPSDFSNFETGVYFIQIKDNQNVISYDKIIKK